ncbi:MAG TPA: PAS domain S-box protein [Anaeromyxobacteraceae bacterium]|nr:PAS domain S-box protein [Anaeromyxobacteraceae bacterium]
MPRRARGDALRPRREEREGVTRLALARHLESFTRYSGDILLLFDPAGRLVEANERAVEAYGHSRKALMALGADDLCAGQGTAEVRRRLTGAPAEGVVYEAVHRRADGSTFPVEVSARLITIEGSTYLQAIVRDISERRRAEATVAYQAMLLANMNEAVMGLDDKFLARAWNRAAERIYGWKAEEVMGRPILRLLDTQYHRGFDQAMLSRLQEDGRIRLEMRQRRKDGSYIDVEGVSVALRDQAGRITGYVAVNRDVTDRRRAEEALRLSEERLKLALEATGDGLWELNLKTGSGYLSPSWAERLGVPGGDLQDGRATLSALDPEEGSAEAAGVAEHVAGGRPWYEYERRLSLPGGGAGWVLCRGKVVERGPRGEPLRLIGTLSDVTEKRRLHAQLIQSDRMASMGTLAAGVAHEINNPLAYVVANLGWVAQALGGAGPGGAVPPEDLVEMREALEEARGGAERVRAIVRDLKTFSRGDEPARGPTDVRRVLESALNLARNEIRHRARMIKDFGEVPAVEASEHRLGQVFLNLLINAAQAIPEGRADKNQVRAVTRTDDRGRAVVEIHDTGTGIPPEHLASIFEPFFTTKPPGVGTGLGLAICHGIVTGLGGEIRVTSRPGHGSVFQVILPPARGQPDAPAARAVAPPVSRARILVVDDEPLVGRAVQRILGARHEVVVESSGRAALARVERGETFDLLLCDLMMPELTGQDLLEALERTAPDLAGRVAFLTGGAFTPAAREFLERTARPRLDKPFEAQALERLVAGELARYARP